MKRVVILQETLPPYRAPFLAAIRATARVEGIEVDLVHGRASGARGERLSGGTIAGATEVRNRYVPMPRSGVAVWQPALRRCLDADLVVVEQANRLLVNYPLLLARAWRGPKVAFWGHGRNLQSATHGVRARLKAKLATVPDWWFAYTHGVAQYLCALGYPSSRITVVGNTIDVAALRESIENRRRLSSGDGAVRCVFVGGLYEAKRLGFLFAAADLIVDRVPNFELHIAGAGESRLEVEEFAAGRPWATYWGPVEGSRHAELLASARLLLMPGLVGLVVLDSFAAGVPLVTTSDARHSPEIEYIENGVNGVILAPGSRPADFADAVVNILASPERLRILRRGAASAAERHLLASAAERFVAGLSAALE